MDKTSVGRIFVPVAILFTFIPEGFNLFFNLRLNKKFLQEFKKTFCCEKQIDARVSLVNHPKRPSSLAETREAKKKNSIPIEVTFDPKNLKSNKVTTNIVLKSIPLVYSQIIPNAMNLIARQHSLPLQTHSILNFNKLRQNSLKSTNSDLLNVENRQNIKRNYSFPEIISKSFKTENLNDNNFSMVSYFVETSQNRSSFSRRHSFIHMNALESTRDLRHRRPLFRTDLLSIV